MRRHAGLALIVIATLGVSGVVHAASPVTLAASDPGFDFFGSSVATTGATTIVGAPENTRGQLVNAGAAYIYTDAGGWAQQAKLVASDAGSLDLFGAAVSISGDTAIVGAYRDDNARGTNAGAAYVFVRSGTVWSQQAKLIAADGATEDRLGMSVAIAGNTAVVGAPLDDTGSNQDAGSAYVFVRSGSTWSQQARLTASDQQPMDGFGSSVSIDGDSVLVGAHQADVGGMTNAGSSYVFTRSGSTWSQQAKLVASDAASSDWFGVSVSVSLDSALVGASVDDNANGINAGAAYVFTRSGTTWTQQAKLVAADGGTSALFGGAVSMVSNVALVGASKQDHSGATDAGMAYAFIRTDGTWILQRTLISADAADRDNLGYAVALGGSIAVTGVPFDDHSNVVDAGSALVFDGFTSPNSAPDTAITSMPPAVSGPSVSFAFVGSDDFTPPGSLTFRCSLDGSAFAPCSSPVAYSGLAGGQHRFRVAARDAEGTLDATPATYTWTVDTAGPVTTIANSNNDVVINIAGIAPAPVTGRATDDAAGVDEVLVTFTPMDGGTAYTAPADLTCSMPGRLSCSWSIAPPNSLGRWRVTARATDALGNTGLTAGPVTIIVIALPL